MRRLGPHDVTLSAGLRSVRKVKQETRFTTWSERSKGNKRVRPECTAMGYRCPGCSGGSRGCALVSHILTWTWKESFFLF